MEVITSRNLNRLVEVDCLGWGPIRSGTVAFSPDGSLLSIGAETGVRLLRADDLREVAWPRHRGVCRLAFSPDGTQVATGDEFGLVRLWDTHSGNAAVDLPLHGSSVTTLAFSPDSRLLCVRTSAGAVRLWDAASCRECYSTTSSRDCGEGTIEFSRDGGLLVIVGRDEGVRVVDLGNLAELAPLLERPDRTVRASVAPDGATLATCSEDGIVVLWDLPDCRERLRLGPHPGEVHAIAFSPSGAYLAVGWSQDTVLYVLDTRSGQPVHALDVPGASFASFSPDGRVLTTFNSHNSHEYESASELQSWDTSSWRSIGGTEWFDGDEIEQVTLWPGHGALVVRHDDIGAASLCLADWPEMRRCEVPPVGETHPF
jgi:WD40 repeat protein